MDRGAAAEAERLIEAVEKLRPRELRLEDRLSILKLRVRLAAMRDAPEAEARLLDRILKLAPRDGESWLLVARLRERLGDLEAAFAALDEAARIEGFEAESATRRGQILVRLERYQEAISYLELAQRIQPRDTLEAFLERVRQIAERTATPVPMGSVDTPPKAIEQPAPVLSAELIARTPARATVVFVLGIDGKVEDAAIHDSSDPAFDTAVLDAVNQWKFEPAKRDGKPVRVRIRVPISLPSAKDV